MINEKKRLENHINFLYEKYSTCKDDFAAVKISDDKWSIKEIFGHLIDSASNNYQRFVRLQEVEELSFPAYDFNWINIVKYNSYSFRQIIELWKQLNLLLVHIIDNIDSLVLNNYWLVNKQKLSLEFLIKDYIDHMEIHIKQLKERIDEVSVYVNNLI